ncbi:MAG TPA: HAD family hydrolase [Candidatus Cybelea sp.]|nr:HAD family hydrolase [Candidatus Cybelea sp.]
MNGLRTDMDAHRPRAILFDWDNTLIDSWAVIHAAMNQTLEAMGRPLWTRDETETRVRASLRDGFPELFGERWRDAEKIFYAAFAALHLERLIPLPGSVELLRELAETGLYLGVVSNKRGDFLRLEAERLGWLGHFRRLAGAGDSPRDKPCREHVDHALGTGSAHPGPQAGPDVWFVGDADIDMLCARNAGCRAILVRAQPPAADEFGAAAPDLYFSNLPSLAAHLRQT